MEDGARIHEGYAKGVRKLINIPTFFIKWPASSPDLNAIKKVWRWMKDKILEMEPFPTTIEELKAVVQDLWDQLDPCGWILQEIEKMPAKLEAVIDARGYQTRY